MKGYKTYIIVILGLMAGIHGILTGGMSIGDFFQSDYFLNFLNIVGLGTMYHKLSRMSDK